jgi:selenocysteine lyase/cysteine desulfurase
MSPDIDVAPLILPNRFLAIDGISHMAAGAEAPMLDSHRDAIDRFLRAKGEGMIGRAHLFGPVDEARRRIAGLLGLGTTEIAFLLNASDGLAQSSMGLSVSSCDNVVLARCEYPSLALALLPLRDRGVEIRFAGNGMIAEIDDYAACIDARTRAIFVSHVSHLTGDRMDIAAFRELADRVSARLVVDASHSLGAVPVDGSLCDAVVSSCYKWLLGVHGCGVFAVNALRWPELMPSTLGWHSVVNDDDWRCKDNYQIHSDAKRFETGNPPFLALHVLCNALRTLDEATLTQRAAHIEVLGRRLRQGLVSLGLHVTTPETSARRAGNFSFSAGDAVSIEANLRANGVLVLAGSGRIRISVHLYNSSQDVDRCLDALSRTVATR